MQKDPIPAQTFFGHVEKIYETWNEVHTQHIKKYKDTLDSIILINGKVDDGNEKTVALVTWFFAGFNLADTIIAFGPKILIIYSSERKIAFLANLKENSNFQKYNVQFFMRQEDAKGIYEKIWKLLHGEIEKPKVGLLLKNTKVGPVAEDFSKFVEEQSYEQVQASNIFFDCLMIKDTYGIDNLKKAGKVTTYFLQKYISEVQGIIDKGKSVKHIQLVKKIQNIVSNEGQLKKCAVKLASHKISKDFIDVGPAFTLQSGGTYNPKLFCEPNDSPLKSDCILLSMGTLYRGYNSYCGRTLLIDPTSEQKTTYKKIQALQKVIIQNLRQSVKISSIYRKAQQFLKENLPNVQVPKSFGFGTGVFMCENNLAITANNDTVISIGCSFLINCTFNNLKYQSKKGPKLYSVQLIDTVVITDKGQQITTAEASKNLSDISYELDDAEQQQKEQLKDISDNPILDRTSRRTKHTNTMQKMKNQKERAQHQYQLKLQKLEELKTRSNQNFSGNFKKQKTVDCSRLMCYKSREDFPKQMKKNQIYIDSKNNCILLPINGRHVPFHINILKSVVKNDEGQFISLRFNFHLPGTVTNLVFPKIGDTTIFIKEMVFRSADIGRLTDLQKQVKTLQRKVRMQTDEKHAKQDIVQQQKLSLNKGKRPVLKDLFARPGIGQKKVKGSLECHLNGFRYLTTKGQQIDISFTNIKYGFFQPCQKEIIAAIHFRLIEPIMVAKKKTQDIQFYSQGGQNAQDIGGRGRGQDSDDQQKQKQARKKLDREFQAWMKNCQQFIGKIFEFEIPKRSGGFTGTPFRTSSLLQPTKSCLINITQYPFFVLPVADIEVACFQRMYTNIKNFDITFVYRDFETHIRVNSIPIQQVEKVKNWMDNVGIIFYDLGKNLNWSKFLLGIRSDFKKFVQDGAWTAWDSDNQEQQQDPEQGDSQFSAESDEVEDSDDSQQSQSDYAQQKDDDSDSDAEEDLSQEGLSWDEMEQMAEKQDKQKIRRDQQKHIEKSKKKR